MFHILSGTTSSDAHFQAYLMDGLSRWNEDRARQSAGSTAPPDGYSGLLRHCVNDLSQDVLQTRLLEYECPWKYTGK